MLPGFVSSVKKFKCIINYVKIIERDKVEIPTAQIHDRPLLCLATDTSIKKKWRGYLVVWAQNIAEVYTAKYGNFSLHNNQTELYINTNFRMDDLYIIIIIWCYIVSLFVVVYFRLIHLAHKYMTTYLPDLVQAFWEVLRGHLCEKKGLLR